MPRFSVAFGRRRSTVTSEEFQNGPVVTSDQQQSQSSFRVLERTEVGAGQKSFDGGHRLLKAATTAIPAKTNYADLSLEDNMFVDVKNNRLRGSGSSNTTKTTSTDTSSRHSNVSTTPSSADLGAQGAHEEWRNSIKKSHTDVHPPKHSSGGFLSKAGRTFSFGGQKKQQASVSSLEDHPLPPPPLPTQASEDDSSRRPRGLTASTASTATPPKLSEEDFSLNFGSDFGNMFKGSGFDKRASQMTLPGNDMPNLGPRSLTTNRVNQPQPSPIKIDKSIKVEASPYSWSSQHSNDNLLHGTNGSNSPTTTDRTSVPSTAPPPVPRHGSPLAFRNNVPSDIIEDEDANLLKDSLAASRFLGNTNQPSNASPSGRFRRNEDAFSTGWDAADSKDEDNMFDNNSTPQPPKTTTRYNPSSHTSPPRNKVMTPAEFEKYRKDKERRDSASETAKASNGSREDDEDQYEDDEDDVEKAKQAAKQRRKQEAHMAVYRQQMMKVTGETPGLPSEHASRPSLSMSLSTPNLAVPPGPLTGMSDGSEGEDEEVPLAILAAHGFPNKNKPPARLMNMASNPDLRSSVQSQPPQPQRPGSSMGEGTGPRGTSGGHLPAFARKLPQDPFLGAGLINGPPRESLTFGGGSPAPGAQPPSVPMGGLVGVIASEERSRAMRRGSPNMEAQNVNPFTGAPVDPGAGIPPQMMYSNMNGLNGMNGGMNNGMNGMNGMNGGMGGGMGGMGMPQMPQMPPQMPQMPQMMLTPGDQAQIQMTQQMQQFMQMQMQFMQMMATPNQAMNNGMARPMSHVVTPSVHESQRQSFFGDSMLEPPRVDPRSRTMSMVQPSSASWIQPPGAAGGYTPSIHGGMGGGMGGGYAPSIHAQGAGYAPSIAPSERSNVGLPGRYRPVTHAPQPIDSGRRMSVMSGAMGWDEPPKVMQQQNKTPLNKSGNNSDDDDEEGWAAMKAKKEKKRSLWKTKKSIGSEIGALIS